MRLSHAAKRQIRQAYRRSVPYWIRAPLSKARMENQYDVYRRVVPWPFRRLRGAEIYANPYDSHVARMFTTLLSGDTPVFVGRIGGSDWEAVKGFWANPRLYEDPLAREVAVRRVSEFNGYFDFAGDHSNFIRYLECLTECYERADCLLYAGQHLTNQFGHNVFYKDELPLLRHVCQGKSLINYLFMEDVRPFLDTFRVWGEGRRILIVSPFSRTIEIQNRRRNELIVDYKYPDFELLTYQTPVTYNTGDGTKNRLQVSVQNWHEQCELMAQDISRLDFDIAWLSCASYGMYLGDFIRNEMHGKAVYIGGILNVLFNIYGQRYDASYYNRFIRPETRIEALENADMDRLSGGRLYPNEALRAYFGKKPPE